MKIIDKFIEEFLHSNEFQELLFKQLDVTFPVSFTYALERLIITHVKLFMLEDEVRKDLSNDEIGLLKKKIDHLNGVIRPQLIASLGDILAQAVKTGNLDLVREPNNKKYGS